MTAHSEEGKAMGTIERVMPLITVEQTIELVKLAVSSKTNEMELAVAMALKSILMPPMIYKEDTTNADR